jgi:hypothetical protein
MLPNSILKPTFPAEIMMMIGTHLEAQEHRETLSSLTQTSRQAWMTLTPLLYSSVTVARRNSLDGVMKNFGYQRPRLSLPPDQYNIGKPNGLRLLRMIQTLTLEAIPRVVKISDYKLPDSSDWHVLRVFSGRYEVLKSQIRLKRLTIQGTAIQQLAMANSAAQISEHGFDQVIMPSDGIPPAPHEAEFAFLPQSGFPLATLIEFFQPLHLIVQYPLTWFQPPRPESETYDESLPHEDVRLHEVLLREALAGLNGNGATACAHDVHDQFPPVGLIGARHHISFVSFPSVPNLWVPPECSLPYVSLHVRILQIKAVIKKSNPIIPNVATCAQHSRRPISLRQWEASRAGTLTFYRAGAMVTTGMMTRDEWAYGSIIEDNMRSWVNAAYSEEMGHPEGFANAINSTMRFIHGGPEDDPHELVCEAGGHKCTIPVCR